MEPIPLRYEAVSLDRQEEYRRVLAACPQLVTSDYALANVFGWAEPYGLEWSFSEGLVWIRQTRPEPVCWAPIGPWDNYDWNNCPLLPSVGRFTRIPEYLAMLWRQIFGPRIRLEECREHWDYVYRVEDMISLAGDRLKKKKAALEAFTSGYDHEYTPMGPECVEEVLAMQEKWLSWHEGREPSLPLVMENRAIARVLQHFDQIGGLMGGAIRVRDKVVAYTVAEPLGKGSESLVIHFEKADTRFEGAYQAINRMFLSDAGRGYTYVNREQDLGDEGLRKAKLSYDPALFLKKYGGELQT